MDEKETENARSKIAAHPACKKECEPCRNKVRLSANVTGELMCWRGVMEMWWMGHADRKRTLIPDGNIGGKGTEGWPHGKVEEKKLKKNEKSGMFHIVSYIWRQKTVLNARPQKI